MGATVTNEDLGVTTTTSEHTAATMGPTDVCYDPPKVKPVPHVNHVTTDKAIEHTSGKTLFQNGNVVRVGEAIKPSDPAHGDSGGGVASGTYREEARATRGSPNIRAEGKAPARSDDPTTQNHANTTGKIFQQVPPGLLEDNPEEFYKRCSYAESKIKCGHHDFTNEKLQIDVWRGDTITIEAKRKNAKVPEAPPDCIQPPHMKWRVTRSGGVDMWGAALPEMSAEFTGDTLELSGDWTAPQGTLEYGGEQKRDLQPALQRELIEQKNALARSNAAIRGSSRVEGQDTRAAYQTIRERIDATDNYHRPRLNMARATVSALVNLAQLMVAWRAHQNPVRVAIVGTACSGGESYEVHGYPNSKYTFQFPLDGLILVGRWISRVFTVLRSIGQLANVPVENNLKCPGENVAVGIEFQWKEQDEPETYAICREAEISASGQFFEWSFEVKCPLANFLAIIPVLGGLAARAVSWIIQRCGGDASIGIGAALSLSVAALVKFKWTKKAGWEWASAGIKLPLDFRFYLFVRIRVRDWMHIEGQAVVAADPALLLEGTATGLVLKSDDFMVRIGFAGVIHVDTWFYSFHESATWYPESWTFRVDSLDLWPIIGS